jgi:hypothetical protein
MAVGVAALGLAASSAIAASTLLPSAPVVAQWPQFVLFALAPARVTRLPETSAFAKRRLMRAANRYDF